jgi:hypothetical protein
MPSDDASMVEYLQKSYREAGIDPSNAINQDDIVDFGGFDNFRT